MRRLRSLLPPFLLVVFSLAIGIPLGGCDRLFGIDEVMPPPIPTGFDNGYTCECRCTYADGGESLLPLQVCVPAGDNPNLNGGTAPSAADLMADCRDRVQVQVARMSNKCFTPNPSCECVTADPLPDTFFDASCDEGCVATLLDDCATQWDPANGVKSANCGGAQLCVNPGPVCLREGTDPPTPTPSPLAAGIMARNTLCRVSEDESSVTVGAGDHQDTSALRGLVNFAPAPPAACGGAEPCLSMDYRFDTTETIHFDGFLGFGDTDLTQIVTLGASTPFPLGNSGVGSLGTDSTQTSGRGFENGEHRAAFGTNAEPVVVGLDGSRCTVQGVLVGGVGDPDGDNENASVSVDAAGLVENGPPAASFGSDRTVECTSPTGADVTLDAGATTDPDDNVVSFTWYREVRGGDVLGTGPTVTVHQALGDETYVLTAIDAYMQAGEASATIGVADTTAPVIACNAPATITPRDTPYDFQATATDVCDDALSAPRVVDYDCYAFNKTGRRVARRCDVAVAGDTFTIIDSGGIGDFFEWRVEAGDGSGNDATTTCETEIVRPGPGPT